MTKTETSDKSNGKLSKEEELRETVIARHNLDKKHCQEAILGILKKFDCRIDIRVTSHFNSGNGRVAYRYEPIIEKNEA